MCFLSIKNSASQTTDFLKISVVELKLATRSILEKLIKL